MFSLIYNLYFNSDKRTFLGKTDFFARLYALIISKYLPLCFKFSSFFALKGHNSYSVDLKVVVSLTSYPGRINIVWQSIESLFHQTEKPFKVVLWLGNDKYSDVNELPSTLKRLMKRGLIVKFRDDLKPHTKYFYAMSEYPDCHILTVDDDILYPSNMIENLVKVSKRFPNSIICHGARLIQSNKNGFALYREWKNWHATKIESIPRYDLLPLGVMGVLYPPKSLNNRVFDVDSIRRLCLKADDLWLKSMAIKQKTTAVLTNSYLRPFIEVRTSQLTSLMATNVTQNQNDTQIEAIDNELNIFEDYMNLMNANKLT